MRRSKEKERERRRRVEHLKESITLLRATRMVVAPIPRRSWSGEGRFVKKIKPLKGPIGSALASKLLKYGDAAAVTQPASPSKST